MSKFMVPNKAWFNVLFCFFAFFASSLSASRPVNRHLPFWTDVFRDAKKGSVSSSVFMTDSQWKYEPLDRSPKVFKPFGGMALDLMDLEDSYNTYFSQAGLPKKDYFQGSGPTGLSEYKNKRMPMEPFIDTKTMGVNLSFYNKWDNVFDSTIDGVKFVDGFKSALKGSQVFVGAELPIIHAHRVATYQPGWSTRFANSKIETTGEIVNEKLRMVLSQMASDAGLKIGNWTESGLGDLNFYVGFGNKLDYVLRCRSIDFSVAFGVNLPTGKRFDPDNPLSFSFGRDGISYHTDLMAQIELKQGLRVGGSFEWNSRARSEGMRRMPIKSEAEGWSPLRTEAIVYSGSNYRISPYITLENFMDWWLDFSVGFSYLKSGRAEWIDPRNNPAIKTFIENAESMSNSSKRILASEWSAKYFHFKLSYDPSFGASDSGYSPMVWLAYDNPFERDADVSNRRLSLGLTVKF